MKRCLLYSVVCSCPLIIYLVPTIITKIATYSDVRRKLQKVYYARDRTEHIYRVTKPSYNDVTNTWTDIEINSC